MTSIDVAAGEVTDFGRRESLVEAMMKPAFYPRMPVEVTHEETHISHLFFVGNLVYKIKKPVRFSFLDFSTLQRRRFYLQQELQLNRRLAPSVYLGVMPIAFEEYGWRLGGWSEPQEYTLVMRRLPAKRMLPFLLATNQVTPAMMQDLASLFARFHNVAEIIRGIDPQAYVAALENQWTENVTDLEPFIDEPADRNTLKAIDAFGHEFLAAHRNRLLRRAEEGWVRDVHGDLHADHICFAPEGIQIFDCIEFSAQLRRCDLASEIAFLLMDLTVRGGESLREPFVSRYRELRPDAALLRLLPFFECYRALVRAKVHALRLGKWNDYAARYFRFAARLTWEPRKPFLVVVCGFTGSGKSTLARELGERLAMAVINSDTVRKAMAGTAGRRVVPFNQGIYCPDMTERTYTKMAREAEKQILNGKGAILDATFARQAHREKMAHLAVKHKVPIFWIRCLASDEVIHQRLADRAAEGRNVSDGGWEIYLEQKIVYQPLDEISSAQCLDLDTVPPVEDLGQAVESFLRSRLQQKC